MHGFRRWICFESQVVEIIRDRGVTVDTVIATSFPRLPTSQIDDWAPNDSAPNRDSYNELRAHTTKLAA